MQKDQNKKTATSLALIAIAMFGFGYALVPMYNVICEITGLNGKTGRVTKIQAESSELDQDRLVTIQFDTNVNSELPWKFGSMIKEMQIHPGELSEAVFYAENLSTQVITGQAVPSVASAEASMYFNKTECFCFTQQSLGPGERIEMPVRFIVDPKLPERISMMTLSYTFFRVPSQITSTVSGYSGT